MWHVYIIRCKDGRLYTGMTNDLERRLKQHRQGRGAQFTRSFGVDRLLYHETLRTRRAAMRRELLIKSWPRTKKLALVRNGGGKTAPARRGGRRPVVSGESS